jgi:hypothetical protein
MLWPTLDLRIATRRPRREVPKGAKNLSEHLLEDPLLFGVNRFCLQGGQEVPLAENVCQHGGLQTPRVISWSSLPNMLSVGHTSSGGEHD